MPLVLGHQARQRGGHLRPQRHVAPALVLEAEQLAGELATGFFQVKRGVLEDRRFVFDIPTAAGHRAPGLEQIIADRAFTGNEIAESGKRLEGGSGHGRAARMHGKTGISRQDCAGFRRPETGGSGDVADTVLAGKRCHESAESSKSFSKRVVKAPRSICGIPVCSTVCSRSKHSQTSNPIRAKRVLGGLCAGTTLLGVGSRSGRDLLLENPWRRGDGSHCRTSWQALWT